MAAIKQENVDDGEAHLTEEARQADENPAAVDAAPAGEAGPAGANAPAVDAPPAGEAHPQRTTLRLRITPGFTLRLNLTQPPNPARLEALYRAGLLRSPVLRISRRRARLNRQARKDQAQVKQVVCPSRAWHLGQVPGMRAPARQNGGANDPHVRPVIKGPHVQQHSDGEGRPSRGAIVGFSSFEFCKRLVEVRLDNGFLVRSLGVIVAVVLS
ncbi:hypothetical protein M409DRAFT_58367 [Zasmidium cellare ATCC 36951]|uniref:Uncharacterized protein n=1 Tax=Zasmidium cellare ATCC 36951 TaxID=1080233 RepID=A0A6A6C5T5_ZASCE|nr:uncharacterized protein M409DRAFT_58367 [Zasmidium cellare ATCC 36951]KAF2162253.1 hypothetical protein M409DRAFT_58367 [Zasmidium cellare ATCC 36951]